MKKLVLLFSVITLLVTTGRSQEVFSKRDFVGHVGFGIGSYLGGSGYRVNFPPLLISGEYGIVDNLVAGHNGSIGVGAYLAFTSTKNKVYDIRSRYFIFGARSAFHYQFVNDLDTYAGVMLAYKSVSNRFPSSSQNYHLGASGLIPGGFIGARYYFTPNLAAFGELGYGIAALELGIAFRF